MTVYALDPGPTHTAFLVLHEGAVLESSHLPNEELLAHLLGSVPSTGTVLAVEWIEGMGMAVGRETFETCYWVGRFVQAWSERVLRVPRRAVKVYLCGTVRAKDKNVRQALIDKIGKPGTKKVPGPTYGVSSHGWQALGVAVTAQAKLDGDPDLACVVWNDEV